MNLSNDAMLVTLRIQGWSARCYDRKASQFVAVRHDADASAGRYNKRLLPKVALASLNATLNEARKTHYHHTLPWDDVGARLLPVANYERYTGTLDRLIERMRTERSRFIADYDNQVRRAKLDLGRLFSEDDYPSREELLGRFSARYRIVPVPDSGHFLAELANGASERVRKDIQKDVTQRLNGALADLYRRLGEAVGPCLRTPHRGRERQAEGFSGQPHREPAGAGGHRAPAERLPGRAAQRAVPRGAEPHRLRGTERAAALGGRSIPPCAGASSATRRTWRRISRGTSARSAPNPTRPRPPDGPRDRHRGRAAG